MILRINLNINLSVKDLKLEIKNSKHDNNFKYLNSQCQIR
jgi:hypothetical protein